MPRTRHITHVVALLLAVAPWLCCPLHATASETAGGSSVHKVADHPCPHHTVSAPEAVSNCGPDCGPDTPAAPSVEPDQKPPVLAFHYALEAPSQTVQRPLASLARTTGPPGSTPVRRNDVLLA